MQLAKPYLDVALFTTNPQEMVSFWAAEIGATLDHVLPIREGHDQHRMDLYGSVIKINSVNILPKAPASGYRKIFVASEKDFEARELIDPDGNCVTLVPKGYQGIEQIAVGMSVRSASSHADFFATALQLPSPSPGIFEVGQSRILIEENPSADADVAIAGPGWRYLTIQIFNAEREHRRFLASGGYPGMPIQRLDDVAIFAMVRDPDGNWIELSQRASLTGPLPSDAD